MRATTLMEGMHATTVTAMIASKDELILIQRDAEATTSRTGALLFDTEDPLVSEAIIVSPFDSHSAHTTNARCTTSSQKCGRRMNECSKPRREEDCSLSSSSQIERQIKHKDHGPCATEDLFQEFTFNKRHQTMMTMKWDILGPLSLASVTFTIPC